MQIIAVIALPLSLKGDWARCSNFKFSFTSHVLEGTPSH